MPTDPTSSLYLSRMADYSALHPRRRLYRRTSDVGLNSGMESTMHAAPASPTLTVHKDPSERAADYDRALRTSRMRGGLGQSRMYAGGAAGSTMFQSTLAPGAMALAQTAVLGDSHGTLSSLPPPSHPPVQQSVIPEEDLMADGGVVSALGESYVDGRRIASGGGGEMGQSQREEDEALEDGGVLGLLAQIYGTGVNVKGRGRGPPKAI